MAKRRLKGRKKWRVARAVEGREQDADDCGPEDRAPRIQYFDDAMEVFAQAELRIFMMPRTGTMTQAGRLLSS